MVTVPETAIGRVAPILPLLPPVCNKHLWMSPEKSFEPTTRKQTGSRLKLEEALPVPIWIGGGLVTVPEAGIGRVEPSIPTWIGCGVGHSARSSY